MSNRRRMNDSVSKTEWHRRAAELQQMNATIGAMAVQMEADIQAVVAVLDAPTRLLGASKVSQIEDVVGKYRKVKVMEKQDAKENDTKKSSPSVSDPVPFGVGATA